MKYRFIDPYIYNSESAVYFSKPFPLLQCAICRIAQLIECRPADVSLGLLEEWGSIQFFDKSTLKWRALPKDYLEAEFSWVNRAFQKTK